VGGKKPLGRPRRRWEDDSKLDLQEVGWEHRLDLSDLGYGQVAEIVNAVMNLRFSWRSVCIRMYNAK
jgi:hypothetical protein